MVIELVGVDLDGNQTPGITDDDVTELHIHNEIPGMNGPIVFGLIMPNDDLNNDLIIDAAAGRISSAWDAAEGLAAQLANLRDGELYFNVHTVGNPNGEIRGQILPAGGMVHMLQSSDTGMSLLDNVTSKMAPAFTGKAEANAKVRVLARNLNTGTVNLVGQGVVGTDLTDGVPDNGFGIWEVTVEPMADGAYEIFVEFEDSAGNLSMHFDFAATGLPSPIVDNTSQDFLLDVQHLFGNIQDIDVKLDITHRIVEDLDVFLISPNNTQIELFTDLTVTGDNLIDTVLDDEAAMPITAGDTPFTGRFQPEQALAGLNGEDPNGTWILRIVDDADSQGVSGMLNDFRLCIKTDAGLPIVIDTVAPNTPFLDLLQDTGRSDVDNITMDNTTDVSMTTEDPNVQFAQTLFTDNLKFRIFDRFEGNEEFLLYDSAQDIAVDNVDTPGDAFTRLQLILETLGEQFVALNGAGNFAVNADETLVDGVHNLKLEAEDRAGNISHDFLLNIEIDSVAPPVSIGLAGNAIDGIDPSSTDTGVEGQPNTFVDRITSDTGTGFWGRAEADAIVRLYVDAIRNDAIDAAAEFGLTVALPDNGNNAFPDGMWMTYFIRDLNDPNFFPLDGVREVLVEAEDVAGNVNTVVDLLGDGDQILDMFIDTQGPRITAVEINNLGNPYDLFDPKPSEDGPTPPVDSLVVSIEDLPNRAADFLYAALATIPEAANQATGASAGAVPLEEGHFQIVGDHSGIIPIVNVTFTSDGDLSDPIADDLTDGNTATGFITINFADPLPDDRFTMTISDSLVDPPNNQLDGESNASEPQENPDFPTGDGVPGGDFVARFTVDSRPEIATYCCGSITADINGNLVFDPEGEDNDATNRDLTFVFGLTTDALFAGNFPPNVGGMASGFDKLGAYGFADGNFRFLLDVDHDGAFTPGVDRLIVSAVQINALPVAGNFDGNAANGDEIGLFDGTQWFLDLNGDQILNEAPIATAMRGRPIVGDFNGDGTDDLATYDPALNLFSFANGLTGAIVDTLEFGFTGITERPVAGDLNLDGVDDLGLWVPDRNTQDPDELSEWFFLVSDPIVYSPSPLGNDIFAQFGDIDALPLFANLDPPVTNQTSPTASADFTGDGLVDGEDIDMLFDMVGQQSTDAAYDVDGDGALSSSDVDYMVEDILGTTPGDTDVNGVVDIFDVSRVVGNFSPFGSNYRWQDGDFDGDGDVDIVDITSVVSNFNPFPTDTAAPSTATATANDAVFVSDSAGASDSGEDSVSAPVSTSISQTPTDDGVQLAQATDASRGGGESPISAPSVNVWHSSDDAESLPISSSSRTRGKLGILPAEGEGLDS